MDQHIQRPAVADQVMRSQDQRRAIPPKQDDLAAEQRARRQRKWQCRLFCNQLAETLLLPGRFVDGRPSFRQVGYGQRNLHVRCDLHRAAHLVEAGAESIVALDQAIDGPLDLLRRNRAGETQGYRFVIGSRQRLAKTRRGKDSALRNGRFNLMLVNILHHDPRRAITIRICQRRR